MVLLKGSQLQIRTSSNHFVTVFELLLSWSLKLWFAIQNTTPPLAEMLFQRNWHIIWQYLECKSKIPPQPESMQIPYGWKNTLNDVGCVWWYSVFAYSLYSSLRYLFSVSSIYWSLNLLIKPYQTTLELKTLPYFCISVYSAMLQMCWQSCSQPWRVLFLERQSRLCHFISHKVHDSWAEALWTPNEGDWIWGWLRSYCTIVYMNHDVRFPCLSQE